MDQRVMDDKSSLDELWEKIKSVRIAMLTTITAEGRLHSRPMATQQKESGPALWFFTDADSPKVADITRDDRVGLAYASPDKDLYVTVSGRARVLQDEVKAGELWNVYAKAWYPQGPQDPNLRLIEVTIEQAEYWHDRKPKVLQFAQVAVAAMTGRPPQHMGEDRKLSF